ncbi:MAG: LamG-like jellyroll fold domain-containing protein, partial [Verrucomicrobiales bacterium]
MKRFRLLSLSAFAVLALFANQGRADLVAHWPLDVDASDATGNGFNGMIVDGTVTFGGAGANGNTGSSANFPDNGHIDVPFDEALNPASFTVALWANADSTGGFASPITSRDDVAATSVWGYVLYNNDAGNWDFWTGGGGPSGSWDRNIGPPVSIDTWTHLALTYDATDGTKTLWVNGVAEASDTQLDPTQYLPNGSVEMENLHIGAGADLGDSFFFSGDIDDVGIWDEVLDEAAIQGVMMNGIGSDLPDPLLSVANPIDLSLDGTVQEFDVEVTNAGETQDLTVSAAEFTGDPNFTLVSLPAGAIAPGATGNIRIQFDPGGANGAFQADMDITSNDGANPVRTTVLRGTIHDPMLVADATLDLGTETSGSLTVTNDGAT